MNAATSGMCSIEWRQTSAAALKRFVATAFCVGVRMEADDSLSVFAPFGLDAGRTGIIDWVLPAREP